MWGEDSWSILLRDSFQVAIPMETFSCPHGTSDPSPWASQFHQETQTTSQTSIMIWLPNRMPRVVPALWTLNKPKSSLPIWEGCRYGRGEAPKARKWQQSERRRSFKKTLAPSSTSVSSAKEPHYVYLLARSDLDGRLQFRLQELEALLQTWDHANYWTEICNMPWPTAVAQRAMRAAASTLLLGPSL